MSEPATPLPAGAATAAGELRLLLDPYLCCGPGTEELAPLLEAIARRAAALGIVLCVEARSWAEAAADPDVRRRGVALWRFEPLRQLPDLPLPSVRDLRTRFVPARSEIDEADLRLLGALHARVADLLVAEDGRLHRLAARAAFGDRVLTPWDALAWLEALGGRGRDCTVTEIDPGAGLTDPVLARILAEDCEPFDPYLASRLGSPGSRMLVADDAGDRVALGVLAPDAGGLLLSALATTATARGRRALEPLVAAALATARRLRLDLHALLPPHQDQQLLLLAELGFERRGRDRHGREILQHAPGAGLAQPAPGHAAWLLPLDAATHDRLVPELAGATQAELFADRPAGPTLGSRIHKQLWRNGTARAPAAGDLLLLFHEPARERIRAASLTAAARVRRVRQATTLPALLAMTGGHEVPALPALAELLQAGPVTVFDLHWLGRLVRPLPAAALIERGVIGATPRNLLPLEPEAWQRLAPGLALA